MARIDNPDIYRLRAAKMLDQVVLGKSHAQIAEMFGCSVNTVERSLAYASREGLTKQYETDIIGKLAPLAIKVYIDKLNKGDEYVAKHVIDKLIELGERFEGREQVREEIALSSYLANKRKIEAKHDKSPGSDPSVIDSTPVRRELPAGVIESE